MEKVTDALPLEQLRPWCETHFPPADVVVLEASANSFEICSQLRELGLRTLVLDSTDVGSTGRRANVNDKTSAVKVAKVFLGGVSDEVWVPDPLTRQRR